MKICRECKVKNPKKFYSISNLCNACHLRAERRYKIKYKLFKICIDCKKSKLIKSRKRCEGCRQKLWIKENPTGYKNLTIRFNEKNRKTRKRIMVDLFQLLGNKCKRCKTKNKIVLQIDHINGSGGKIRKSFGSTNSYYSNILKSVKEKSRKYQLLCANCNLLEAVEKDYKISIWK